MMNPLKNEFFPIIGRVEKNLLLRGDQSPVKNRCRTRSRLSRRVGELLCGKVDLISGRISQEMAPGAKLKTKSSLVTIPTTDMVRAAGLEPAQALRPYGFSYHFGFRRLALTRSRFWLVRGLDYTFTVARSRFRCCSSSLYTFAPTVRSERLARDCL